MNLEIPLSSDVEAALRARASAAGRDIRSFVLEAITEKLGDTDLQSTPPTRDSKEWLVKLKECISLHPAATHFVDDSRESIYAGRGE